MSSWSDLLAEHLEDVPKDPHRLDGKLQEQLGRISGLRRTDTVIFYASSFLQKPGIDSSIITREDINGFMNALYGASVGNGLTLILHTPGGDPNAVESIVEYLHSKFPSIEVIVPYLAMSGGAMISLAGDLLVLGRQSQLGPIDPQFSIVNKTHSARAIQEGFNQAKKDIEGNIKLAHLWAPILQNMGPSLVAEADKALSYSKELVMNWLNKRMFLNAPADEKDAKISEIAAYFNAEKTKHGNIHVHGQRIGIQKLTDLGVRVEGLEDDQDLQNAVLTTYHLMTLIFETSPSVKFIVNNKGKMWSKNQQLLPIGPMPPAPCTAKQKTSQALKPNRRRPMPARKLM